MSDFDHEIADDLMRAAVKLFAVLGLAVLMLGSLPAWAGEWHVQLPTVSYHTDRSKSYEESNYGLGVRYEPDDSALAYQAGAYRNSYRRTSVFVIVDYLPLAVAHVRAGLFAGLATGYAYIDIAGVSPIGGAVVRAEVDRFSATLRFAPGVKKHSSVFGLEIGVRFL